MTKVVRFFLGTLLLAWASVSFAGIHPVPLDKNTDSAKCAECHEDKAKGKFVHSAIAMGCTSCPLAAVKRRNGSRRESPWRKCKTVRFRV